MSAHLAHGHTPAEEASQGRAVRRTAATTLETWMDSLPKLGAGEWMTQCEPSQVQQEDWPTQYGPLRHSLRVHARSNLRSMAVFFYISRYGASRRGRGTLVSHALTRTALAQVDQVEAERRRNPSEQDRAGNVARLCR